jgi:hypothetical protein
VVIIDKGNIADGTSKTGSGMCGLFRPSHERRIVQVIGENEYLLISTSAVSPTSIYF